MKAQRMIWDKPEFEYARKRISYPRQGDWLDESAIRHYGCIAYNFNVTFETKPNRKGD